MAKPKTPPTPTPKQLRDLRARLDLTQAEAAARIGAKTRAWVSWENPSQDRRPSPWFAQQIWLLDAGKL